MVKTASMVWFAASLYCGIKDYPIWTVFVLGISLLLLFYIFHPTALSVGVTEKGLTYLLIMVGGSALVAGVPFFLGRLLTAVAG